MQRFACPRCGARAYFHNLACLCGTRLCYDPETRAMVADALACANRDLIGCNWVADAGSAVGLCRSCAMSRVIPDPGIGDNRVLFDRAERAKRWVLANLSNWGWFTDADPGRRPHFLMLSEHVEGRTEQITMGHAAGEITINITEADALIRLQRQRDLGEQYRSMVGHFRHELAHFLFDRLAVAPDFLPAFREHFGDERQDYAAALARHYAAPRDPGEDFITPYATAHPHEDWAETAAHLLHLVDFTDSFASAGLTMPGMPPDFRPYEETDTGLLLSVGTEVAIAVNDINRALDNDDLYPFVLTPQVRHKLRFAHHWLSRHRSRGA
ncbi:putative zinc-binding metallopeptidase [Paracoccus sp. (in: a-proteobacteria)]|uniref:putative zinc-binding metallopeptidase n=1 Tax=Paracoccus sp. TaxID=267 RepID=UPI00272A09C8|nr:putative zinc-binding metallopeptidase [Paracoccus sp. (in: a-proteobacteria)]